MSSPGARNVITRRKKCHHPACPGDPEKWPREMSFYEDIITGLPERAGQ
jgi:hypothetical protein